jgi:peptide methionine sulfoxide reductase MsrA
VWNKKRLFYLKLKSLIQWKIKRDTRRTRNSNARRRLLWCTSSFLRIRGVHAVTGYIGVKQLILPIRKYVMEIRDMKQLKSLSILLKSEIFWRSFATHDPTTINRQGNDGERNTAVRYFITTRSRQKGLHWFNDRWRYLWSELLKISPVSKFYEAERCTKLL